MLMKDKFLSKAVPRGTRTIWRYLSALFLLFTFAIGNVWAYTYNHATSVPEWTVNFNSWNGESDASGATAETVHNPRLYWNGSSYKNNLGTAQDIAFDGGGFYYIYEPNEARQLPTGSALSALSYVVAKAQGSYFKYNNTSSTVTSPVSTINGLTTNSSQTADVTYEFHMPRAGYVRLLIGTDSNGDPTGTANDAWKNVTLSGATTGNVAVTYHANGSTYDVKTKTGATTFSTVTYTSAGKKMRSVEFALNSGTTTMTTNPAKLSNNSGTARKMFIYAVEVYLESAASYTITYDANGGGGTMENSTNTVSACTFTAPTGKEFKEWNTLATGLGDSYDPGDAASSDLDLFAIWQTKVEKFTVKYMDGTDELGSEIVNVGSTPAGLASDPTKDCYTFAGWDPALSAVSGTDGQVVNVSATWTPVYSSSATLISDDVKDNKPNVNTVLAASNIVSSITFATGQYEFTDNTSKPGYYGYKVNTANDKITLLVKQGKRVKVLFGSLKNVPTIKVNNVSKSLDADRAEGNTAENTFTYTASDEDALVSITFGSGTSTLKKVDIVQLYTATRVDAKSDGAGSDANVLETTLPTPTAISGWTFTGWTANEDVKAGEDTKTAGTVLAAGTYTLLANTTFTAQWAEATATYDVTYVSAHGTAPDAENAASVVLAELSETGWAHKGWTANVDVTVDAATVEAGTLIANGKTAILASDVTFTAVWKEIFTVTFDSKDGSAVAPIDVEDGATLAAAPSAPTKDNYVFQGWSETDGGAVVADITAITISDDKTFYAIWALDVQVSEIVFSNSFKGWIHDGQVEVFYMAGESAPTITSYAGKNLKAEGGVVISGDKIIATGTDDSEVEFDMAMTEVTPLATTGAQNFDGTEGYVKTRHAWTSDRKWKMSKYAEDGRVARGETSMYIFLGAAESVTFDWGKQQKTNDVAVYVNGTFVKNLGKDNNSAVELTNGNNMVAFYSLQTSGDVWLNGLTTTPWVPVTAVALKEGEDPISSKEIWETTSFTLTAEVTPDNASNKTITWTSSDPTVATVVNGVVTGVAANATPVTITASTVDGINATCVVTVTTAPAPCETPVITAQPASQAYCAGSEPTLTVAASDPSDGGTLHYAWFKDDAPIGTDASTCVVDGAGTYKVVVTNHVDGKLDASVTSSNAVVTMNVAAAITTQPTGKVEVVSGSEVTLSVVATNATSYQWYICDDAEKANASAISGAEAEDYVFTCTANAYYYCVVGNACGEDIESNVVAVKLEPTGCNLLDGTIPSTAPYIYDNGEWTIYAVTSGGKLDGTSRFVDNAKDFNDNTVNAITYGRVGMTFASDIESLTIYATSTSTGRTFSSISVTEDDITTGTPAYSAVEADKAVATMPGQNKQYIFTADNMILEAGKKYWLQFNGTVTIFKICYTTAIEKPVITAQPVSNTSYESGVEMSASVSVNPVSEGTLSYQWYNAADDSEVDGATTATLTTLVDGEYYVIVTNKLAGHKDYAVKSETATLAHRDATDATLSALSASEGTLDPAFDPAEENYRVDLAKGTTVVPTLSATANMDGYASVVIFNESSFVNYEAVSTVTVTSEDLSATKTYTVHFYVAHTVSELVEVSENTTWDWSAVTKDANGADITSGGVNVNESVSGLVIANYLLGENFDKIEGNNGAYAIRNGSDKKVYQGASLHIKTTVNGFLSIWAADEGHTQTLNVNNAGRDIELATLTGSQVEYKLYVQAGDVTIYNIPEASGKPMRVSKIVFTADATPTTYTRNIAELNVGSIGTLCVDHNVPMGGIIGATFYQIAGKDEYGKIAFDEVNSLEAGKPYIFQSHANVVTLYFGNETHDAIVVNGMYGNLAPDYNLPITEDNKTDIMYIANNRLWNCEDLVGVGLNVLQNRCYIVYSDVEALDANSTPNNGRRRIVVGLNGKDETQGFENLQSGETPMKVMIDGTLYIIRGEKVFDATGRLVK